MSKQRGKSVMLRGFGGCEMFEIQETECENFNPADREVVVRIKACGMNFSDLYTRMGLYTFHNVKPPFIMGSEAAGVIEKVGEGVDSLKVGDRVVCWNFTYGMWVENVILSEDQCFPIPNNMSFKEAASIPINYITAYFAVLDYGNLKSGQSILIQAAAGGVGIAATQLARTVGDVTIFGTASAHKHTAITENGVTHCIDYHKVDFVDEVKCVSPSGVNVILDSLSGYDFVRSQKILKHMGRIIHIGASKMIQGEKVSWLAALKVWWQLKNVAILNLVERNYAVCGLNIASLFEEEPKSFGNALQKIMQLYNEQMIKPRIDSIWSFEQVSEATDHMLKRKNIGKIILVPKLENNE